jgi:Xaa-Pro aminopeptidase
MFKSEVYIKRRAVLHEKMESGIALFLGNVESPFNYPNNTYKFRQDSNFLYYFGLDIPGFAGAMDFDNGKDIIFGNNVDIDDIIWMGVQPTVTQLAAGCGVTETRPLLELKEFISVAKSKGRTVHFLPPYRGETRMTLASLLDENPLTMESKPSESLKKSVIAMRSVKEDVEIKEIEDAVAIAYDMHVTAMKMCEPGAREQEIYGKLEGISLSAGAGVSFPIILSMNGQTLHNHDHSGILQEGRFMVVDAGAETNRHYASDITRTTPVGRKFNTMQKEIYEIVLKANMEAIRVTRPGGSNRDTHILASKVLATGLKDIGLMKGDIDEAVMAGAHALFMPHGIGHMLGLDVHDMEGLGENLVGYNEKVKRSDQFGLAFLRFALQYQTGHVFTVEPGIYFIPDLIDMWSAEKKLAEYINYDKVRKYLPVGGVRIEDNVLITVDGHKVLGKQIPKSVEEIENLL